MVVESIVAGRAVEPEIRMQLDAIDREGARRMLAAALRAEVAEYLGAAEGDRDEQGHALVTRNGEGLCRRRRPKGRSPLRSHQRSTASVRGERVRLQRRPRPHGAAGHLLPESAAWRERAAGKLLTRAYLLAYSDQTMNLGGPYPNALGSTIVRDTFE